MYTQAMIDVDEQIGQLLEITEYYDYATEEGRLELVSTPDTAQVSAGALIAEVLAKELRAPLPKRYQKAQAEALKGYWNYVLAIDALTEVAGLNLKVGTP